MVNSNGISFSGLASGLDTASIIKQLVALERIPIQLLETKKADVQKKLDKIDALADLVKALKEKAETLSKSSSFLAFAVDNPDASVASIAATSGGAAGTHSLETLQLASTDRWAFDGVADSTANLASGAGEQVVFTVGGTTYTVDVDAASSSLERIAQDIEDVAGEDVSTSVVNAGTEANPNYRLVLAAKDSGADSRITDITSTVSGLTIAWSAPDGNGDATSTNNITVGLNAQALVDGLLVERTTNDFSDVLEGVELTVLSENAGAPLTFSVSPDREAIRVQIDEFVEAYNAVVAFANQQSTYTPPAGEDEGAGTTGPLFGDSILASVRSSLRRALFDPDPAAVSSDTEGYSTLGLIGITTQRDGTLAVNGEVLEQKMLDNLELFADLFPDDDGFDNGGADPNTGDFYTDTTTDSGVMASLVREIDRLFGTFEGPIDSSTGERVTLDAIFDLRKDTLRESIRRYDDRIEVMEYRVDEFERNLTLRFTRLEELMGALNAQGAALANALFPPLG